MDTDKKSHLIKVLTSNRNNTVNFGSFATLDNTQFTTANKCLFFLNKRNMAGKYFRQRPTLTLF